jgi:hypothetical protein
MILSAADLDIIATDIQAIIAERPLAVAFRRGGLALAAQTVRVVAARGATTARGEATAAARWPLVVLGPPALDIEIGDRFNGYNGELIEVKSVHNDRRAFTQAGADLAQ